MLVDAQRQEGRAAAQQSVWALLLFYYMKGLAGNVDLLVMYLRSLRAHWRPLPREQQTGKPAKGRAVLIELDSTCGSFQGVCCPCQPQPQIHQCPGLEVIRNIPRFLRSQEKQMPCKMVRSISNRD